MSRNSTHVNCNQIAGTVNQGIWLNDCDPCASSAHLIPNIQQWLRQKFNVTAGGTAYALPADTATIANGTAVSQWNDEIGTNHGVQATGANQPLWNSADSTMLFDGTNDKLTFTNVNYAVGQDFTIVLGFIPVTAGIFTNHALWSGANNDSVTITSDTSIDVKFNNVTQSITGPTLSPQSGLTPPCEMLNVTLRRENDVCQLFVGGLVWGPTFIATGDYDINTVGHDGTNPLDGKVSTFMQFDRALTDKEIWCLDCYLCQGDDEPEPQGCRIDQFKLACHGDTNGTLTANFTGAPAGSTITYLWSTGATTQTISSLGAGSYTCVLTSDNATAGNAADDVVSTCVGIVEGPLAPLACTVTGVDPYYTTGGALVDGSVTAVVTGGWGNQLTYAWTVPGGAAAIGNVATSAVSVPGTYQVAITDSDGCTTTCQVVINLDTPSDLDIECCINEAPCKDDKVNWHIRLDASATYPVTISASGSITGTPAWSGGASVTVASHPANSTPTCTELGVNVGAGPWFSCPSATEQLQPGETWTLTVTDSGVGAAQRSQTCTTTIANPTDVVIAEIVSQPTYCSAGGSDGTITFTATGGTAPYTYTITDPSSTVFNNNAISGVTSGTYVLSATDANGCNVTKNVVIVCPMDPMPTITHVATNPDCYNENTGSTCDGFITWTPSVQTFSGEEFTLVLYDQGGTAIHTQGPVASFPSPHIFGNGGGNLCAGNYTYDYYATNTTTGFVTMIASAVPVTLTDPPVLQCIKSSSSQMSCLGNDGAVTVTASGGTASYTIAWTGPSGFTSTNFALTGLSTSGVYNYTVTDANGCTCSGQFILKQNCTFDATLSADPIPCTTTGSSTEYVVNGGFNLNTVGTGATSWAYDAQTINSFNNITNFFSAPNYGNTTAFLAGPANGMWMLFDNTGGGNWPTQTAGVASNTLCFTPDTGMVQQLHGLSVGSTYTYSITIDAASFTSGDSWTLKVWEDAGSSWTNATLTGTSVLTSAGTHSVTFVAGVTSPVISIEYAGVTASGSTVAWNRLFDNTQGMKMTGGYNAGAPTLQGKGVALSSDGYTILHGAPGNQGGKGTVKTHKVCNAASMVYPYTGGQYAASGPIHGQLVTDGIGDREAISISHDATLCAIGSPYTDQGGNTNNGMVTAYYYTTTNAPSCYGVWEKKGNAIYGGMDDALFGHAVAMSGDGTHIIIGAKGDDNNKGKVYVYKWNSGTNDWENIDTPAAYTGVSGNDNAGYAVAISDDGSRIAFGLPGQDGSSSSTPDAGAIRMMSWDAGSSSYVTMGAEIDGESNEDFAGTAIAMSGDGSIVIVGAEKNDAGGANVQKGHARVYEWSGSAWAQKGQDLDGTEDHGYTGWSVDINTAGTVIAVSAAKTDTDEFGNTAVDAGSVKVYNWNSGTTTWDLVGSEIRGQNAGDYFGFDIMLNGAGDIIAIGAPFNNGDVPGTGLGNVGGAVYLYEKITTGNSATGNGCITNVSVTGQLLSGGTTDIFVSTNVPCGTQPLTFAWTTPTATPQGSLGSNASTAHPLLNIGPGTYQVVVTDANGCTDTETIIIPEPGSVNNSITVTSNVTCSGTGGILTSGTPTGGTAPYSYYWTMDAGGTIPVSGTSMGHTHTFIDNLAAGTYYLEVTDANGCKWNGNAAITTTASGMTLSAVVVDEDLCGDCCGSIDLTVSGGTAPFTYYWTGLGGPYTTEDLSCVSAGTYTVVVTDDNGCTETATYTVGISNYPINFTLITQPTLGTISVVGLSGGTPTYSYQWTLNGVNIAAGTVSSVIPDFTPTQSGLWCLTVTDSFLPDACTVTQCVDVTWVDPVLGYNCTQAFEDTCTMSSIALINGEQSHEFSGYSQAISGDGTTVVVGASQHDCGMSSTNQHEAQTSPEQREYYTHNNTFNMDCGAVRVYTFSAGSPVQKGQTLFGSSQNEWFGAAVAIDTDGNSLMVGASGFDYTKGKVYYYKWDGANWVETFSMQADATGSFMGETVAITGDGLNIAFGAPGAPDGSGNINHGEIRVYTSTDGGNTFAQKGTTITAASPASWSASATNTPALGAVGINDAATRLVVGAPMYGAANNQQGAYMIYEYDGGTSDWTAMTGIMTPSGVAGDMIGHSVTMNSAGDTVAIGMPGKNNNDGIVEVYTYNGSAWVTKGNAIPASGLADALTNKGVTQGATGVELDASGDIIVIGARKNQDGPQGIESGEMKVYKYIDGTWVQQCNSVYGLQKNCHFGTSVDISDDGTRISGGAFAANVSGGGGLLYAAGYVDVKQLAYTTGSTTDHITDGTAFSTTFGAAQVGDFATAIAALDALPMVAGTWYPFAPTGVSAPAAAAGSVNLTSQQGIVQKVTGLTIGHIYDIKVSASTTFTACNNNWSAGMASIKVYNGTTAATLENNNNGGFDGTGDTTVQYKATATSATIMIVDNGQALATGCNIDIDNLTMKRAQYFCEECRQTPCDFATMQLCLDEPCGGSAIAESYNCVDGRCDDPGDGTGTYSTLAACNESGCGQRTTRYNCGPDGCYAVTGGGTYSTLAACQAECGIAGPPESAKWYCQILCPDANQAERYKEDGSVEESGDYKGERQRETVTGGGRCKIVTGSESPAIAADLQYANQKLCQENCPWCKEGEERPAE